MPKCPKCGTQVDKPSKKWRMAGRPSKSGKRMSLVIPLYVCPKCKKSFRVLLDRKKAYQSPIEPPIEPPYGPPKEDKGAEDETGSPYGKEQQGTGDDTGRGDS